MRQLRNDLWQTSLRTTDGINNSGYLLCTPDGNVLFYQAPDANLFEHIRELGGIRYHVLSHAHDLTPDLSETQAAFDTTLCSDEVEASEFDGVLVDRLIPDELPLLSNLEVLFTPGHTRGGISCIYDAPTEERYLFCGDTIIPVGKNWISQIVPEHGGNAELLTQSLVLLRDTRPNLVLSSASVGDLSVFEVEPAHWDAIVDGVASKPPIGS